MACYVFITPDGEAPRPVGSRDSPPSPSMLQGSHALAIMTSSVVKVDPHLG